MFDKISPADQQVVRDVMAKVYAQFEVDNLVDDEKALEAMLKGKIEVVQPDQSLVPVWREESAKVRTRLAQEGAYSAQRLARIESLLTSYRANAAANVTP